ncbi:MAG: hypothetical protein MUO76_18050 [Anaerolineaceae bacterium]|nr:hypothetical protein [Anaerolineaceae bacterium]
MMKKQQLISLQQIEKIFIRAHATLDISGWEKSEISIDADINTQKIRQENNELFLLFIDDCELIVPVNIPIEVEKAYGNARVRGLSGPLDIQRVNGNLAVQQSGKVNISRVSGNCLVQEIKDGLNINRISGNLKGKNVQGMVNIERVSASVELFDIQSGANIRSNGDIHLSLTTNSTQEVNLRTSSDIFINIAANANAQFHVKSGAHRTEIQIGDLEESIHERHHITLVGDGSRKIKLEAGGKVVIKGEKQEDKEILILFEELENLWVELKAESSVRRNAREGAISSENESAKDTKKLTEEAEKDVFVSANLTNQLTENALKNAEERVQLALLRVKHRLQDLGYKNSLSSDYVADESDYGHGIEVSAEERLVVMRLLAEDKVSIEEADHLLEALEHPSD